MFRLELTNLTCDLSSSSTMRLTYQYIKKIRKKPLSEETWHTEELSVFVTVALGLE